MNFNTCKQEAKYEMPNQFHEALKDIADGLFRWELWGRLGWHEIRRRYTRTVIGPFWSSLSLAVFVTSVGFVFANLWGTDIKTFLPFLCSGIVAWQLISTLLVEGCTVFVANEGVMKQFPFPKSVFAIQCVWRNIIVFFHNLLVSLVIVIIFDVPLNANFFFVIPGVVLIALNGIWVTITLGMICARFRDVQQLVVSALQILMLITPIFWPPDQVGEWRLVIVDPNIVYHFVSLIREPLQGQAPTMLNWGVTIGTTIIGWGVAILMLTKYRRKLIFWT